MASTHKVGVKRRADDDDDDAIAPRPVLRRKLHHDAPPPPPPPPHATKSKSKRAARSPSPSISSSSSDEDAPAAVKRGGGVKPLPESGTRVAVKPSPESVAALQWLEEAHKAEAAAAAKVLMPDEDEQRAMLAYSKELFNIRRAAEGAASKVKAMTRSVAKARKLLYDYFVTNHVTALAIPKAARDEADTKLAAAELAAVPAYIRLDNNSSHVTIHPETVQEAIAAVTRDDVVDAMDASKKPLGVTAAFMAAVTAKVRQATFSYTQQISLKATLPRGTAAADVPDAPPQVVKWAVDMHSAEQFARRVRAKVKRDEATRTAHLKAVAPLVEGYFARSGLLNDSGSASARVQIEGTLYRLVRRVSTKKATINFGVITASLWHALDVAWHLPVPPELYAPKKDKGGGDGDDEEQDDDDDDEPARRRTKKTKAPLPDPIATIDALDALLARSRAALADAVTTELAALPPKVVTEIKLYNAAKPRASKEDAADAT